MRVRNTWYASGTSMLRESCEAIVVEIGMPLMRPITIRTTAHGYEVVPPDGWKNTPIDPAAAAPSYYRAAFRGCDKNGEVPPGNLPGSLQRPGGFYKIVHGGEGIAIIDPRSRLAEFFYFG